MWNRIASRKEPYRAILNVYVDGTGHINIIPNYRRERLDEIAVEIGEMLYQFRAALDACIYESAVMESGLNPPPDENKLEFPICITRAEFVQQATRKLGPLTQKRRDIIETVQPYNTPKLPQHLVVLNFNRALGILNDWARIDRHRRLHVVGSWVSDTRIAQIIVPDGVIVAEMHASTCSGFLENEDKIATFRLAGYQPGMKIDTNTQFAIDIALNESPPPCAETDTLENRFGAMLMAVSHVVKSIETSF